jgi:hypothetical protein
MISIFPNPANYFVKIKSSEEIKVLELRNLQGQIINKIEPFQKELNYNIYTLKEGIYLLKFYLKDEIVVKKLVIQN